LKTDQKTEEILDEKEVDEKIKREIKEKNEIY